MANFQTAYNVILKRTVMAQFMAVAHYVYQEIKIPGPKGTITILGNPKMTLHWDKRSLSMVELTPESQLENIGPSGRSGKVHVVANPDDRLKAVCLDDVDPSRKVQIWVVLDPK